MYTATGFCNRHPLYSMGTAFVLQLAISSLSLYGKGNFLETANFGRIGIHNIDLPALGLSITGVHSKQIPSKKGSLLATYTATNFYNNILVIIRISRQQQNRQLFIQLLLAGSQLC